MKPKRVVENFVCENCGEKVIGDGYTDHCPVCLWGKHMDEEMPGDRESGCKGLMKPEYTEYVSGQTKIHYKCQTCGHKFVVREGKNDDCGKLSEIMR